MSCNGRSEISPLHLIAYKCNYQQLRDIHESQCKQWKWRGIRWENWALIICHVIKWFTLMMSKVTNMTCVAQNFLFLKESTEEKFSIIRDIMSHMKFPSKPMSYTWFRFLHVTPSDATSLFTKNLRRYFINFLHVCHVIWKDTFFFTQKRKENMPCHSVIHLVSFMKWNSN